MSDHAEHLEEHERRFYDLIRANVAGNESHALFIVLITFENLSKERCLRKAAEAHVAALRLVMDLRAQQAEAKEGLLTAHRLNNPTKANAALNKLERMRPKLEAAEAAARSRGWM